MNYESTEDILGEFWTEFARIVVARNKHVKEFLCEV